MMSKKPNVEKILVNLAKRGMAKGNVFGAPPAKQARKVELEAKLADEPRLVRMNFDLPDSLRKKLKAKALSEDRTVRDVLEELVRGYVEGKQ
jgi:hypothetical protein